MLGCSHQFVLPLTILTLSVWIAAEMVNFSQFNIRVGNNSDPSGFQPEPDVLITHYSCGFLGTAKKRRQERKLFLFTITFKNNDEYVQVQVYPT